MKKLFGYERTAWGWVQLFHGRNRKPLTNPGGLQTWWVDPERAYKNLRERVAELIEAGATHILLNRPGGTSGYTHVTGASWCLMKSFQQEAIASVIQEFPAVKIVPFIGSAIKDARSLTGWVANGDNSDLGLLFDMYMGDDHGWRETMNGWLSAGVNQIAIDASAMKDRRDHFVGVGTALRDQHDFLTIGEAIPRVGKSEPIQTYAESHPWMFTNWFYRDSDMLTEGVDFDPDTTRVFMWHVKGSARTDAELQEDKDYIDLVIDRGMIPVCIDPRLVRHASDRLSLIDRPGGSQAGLKEATA